MSIIIQKESPDKILQIDSKGKVTSGNKENLTTTTRKEGSTSDIKVVSKNEIVEVPSQPRPQSFLLDLESEPGPEYQSDTNTITSMATHDDGGGRPSERNNEQFSSMPAGFDSIANPDKVDIPLFSEPEHRRHSSSDSDNDRDRNKYDNGRGNDDRDDRGGNDDEYNKYGGGGRESDNDFDKISLSHSLPHNNYYSDNNTDFLGGGGGSGRDREVPRYTKSSSDENKSKSKSKPRSGGGGGGNYNTSGSDTDNITEEEEKAYLLYLLDRMKAKGIHVRKDFSMNSRLKDVKKEYHRIKSRIDAENSIKFQRELLITFCSGVEYVNQAYDPFGADLDGWPDQINDNIDVYDGVFERLHEKYSKKVSRIPPELQLLGTLGMSAIAFGVSKRVFNNLEPKRQSRSYSNSYSKSSGVSEEEELALIRKKLIQNPDMLKNILNSGKMPTREDIPVSRTKAGVTDAYGREFIQSATAPPPPPVQKREMTGPPGGIDDILRKMRSGSGSSGSEGQRSRRRDTLVPNSGSSGSGTDTVSRNAKSVHLSGNRRRARV